MYASGDEVPRRRLDEEEEEQNHDEERSDGDAIANTEECSQEGILVPGLTKVVANWQQVVHWFTNDAAKAAIAQMSVLLRDLFVFTDDGEPGVTGIDTIAAHSAITFAINHLDGCGKYISSHGVGSLAAALGVRTIGRM